MERVRFITHKDRKILYIDFSGCNPEELMTHMREAQRIISSQPEGSVLTLTDVTDARYNRQVSAALKEYTNSNKPFVKAAAVVGVTGMKEVILNAIILFTRRNFSLFDRIDEAKEWLTTR